MKKNYSLANIVLLLLLFENSSQNINISGVVRDREDNLISGATVNLKRLNISTISGIDGRFTLDNGARRVKKALEKAVYPIFKIKGGFFIEFFLQNSLLTINIFSVDGKLITQKETICNGKENVVELPHLTAGLYLLKIDSDIRSYLFTIVYNDNTISLKEKNSRILPYVNNSFTDILTEGDLLEVKKEGYINFCMEIKSFDTSGIEVVMDQNAGNVIDIDGNAYQTIQLGNQIWTVENLKVTHFNDGTPIKYIQDSAEWCNNYLTSSSVPAYCIYGDSIAGDAKYGVFYNWYVIGTGKLAPEGWRVPSDADWDTLINYLVTSGFNYDGSKIDNKVGKAVAAKWGWEYSELEGAVGNDLSKNNKSGFSALPGGLRHWGGSFYSLFCERSVCYLWSSTEYDSLRAWHRHIDSHKNYMDRLFHHKNTAFPVRIMRNVR